MVISITMRDKDGVSTLARSVDQATRKIIGPLTEQFMKDIRKSAKLMAPRSSGALARGINYRKTKGGSKINSYELYATSSYARALDDGHKAIAPHKIRARNAPLLSFMIKGRLIRTREVNHPGRGPGRAHKFTERAIDKNIAKYIKNAEKEVDKI